MMLPAMEFVIIQRTVHIVNGCGMVYPKMSAIDDDKNDGSSQCSVNLSGIRTAYTLPLEALEDKSLQALLVTSTHHRVCGPLAMTLLATVRGGRKAWFACGMKQMPLPIRKF